MRRKSTSTANRHSTHPVQAVRKACDQTQKAFGATLGAAEQQIRNVENGQPLSPKLANRIFLATGAIIGDDHKQPQTFLGDGACGPFTTEICARHRNTYAGNPLVYDNDFNRLLRCLNFTIDLSRNLAGSPQNYCTFDLLYFELRKFLWKRIRKFGLLSDVKQAIPDLLHSNHRQSQELGDSLREFTGPCDLATTWLT